MEGSMGMFSERKAGEDEEGYQPEIGVSKECEGDLLQSQLFGRPDDLVVGKHEKGVHSDVVDQKNAREPPAELGLVEMAGER